MSSEKQLKEHAAQSSKVLRANAMSLPPEVPERDVREGVAASTELGILILTKIGDIRLKQAEQDIILKQLVEERGRFSDILIEGHRSQLELNEEVTRADLNLKKLKVQRSEKIWMRVLAGVLAPAAIFQFWEWMKLLVR